MTETAPDDAVTVPANDDRPHSPALAGFAAVAAALVGVAAVMLYGWTSEEGWHLLITLSMIIAGAVIARPANDPDVRRTWVLGRWVLTGIGAAGVVLGAYLAGFALVDLSIPDGPFFGSQRPELPPPVVILLMLYGVPLVALIILAVRGLRVGLVGIGVVAPVVAVSIMGVAGASASVIAISSLVVAIVCVPLALLSKTRWGSLTILIGLMAASFAVGAGVSPFGSVATSPSRPATKATEASVGTVPEGLVPVVLVLALGAAAVLLALAVSRQDMASGLVGAALFSVPPAYLLIPTLMTGEGVHVSRSLALAAIPLAVLLIALIAYRASALRDVVARALRLPAVHPAGFATAAGVAAVTLTVYSLPAFGLPGRVSGVITLAVLAAAAVLAVRLPGLPGAVLAAVTLVALQLGAPWLRVINGDRGFQNGFVDWQIAAIVGLIVAVAAAVVLVWRHRHAGVWAAAAYLLAGAMANVLWALLDADRLSFGRDVDFTAITVLVLPLLILGVPAAVAALRGSAAGQAVGTVMVAVGAFIPLNVLVSELPSGGDSPTEVALQFSFGPFTPTNVQGVARLLDPGVWTLVGALVMLLLALVLLASTARRPSAPLAATITLAVLVAGQVTVVSFGREWGVDATDGMLGIFAGVAAIVGAVAMFAVITRRQPQA
ncbi:hypothetical protein DMH04_30940 [Kibdelosporangium aridum]|uniref:Uncharacterized protein n=1 Tax=Kibdelosporangium aridum TaxID=2030 RepID=A0A428Z2S2_KIBAR|nr:hypothetical protein [Kibdelosporangium aridum]RSM80015.1 hypothetical protein DMH04_30940 [Kibdelosporangium aridum]